MMTMSLGCFVRTTGGVADQTAPNLQTAILSLKLCRIFTACTSTVTSRRKAHTHQPNEQSNHGSRSTPALRDRDASRGRGCVYRLVSQCCCGSGAVKVILRDVLKPLGVASHMQKSAMHAAQGMHARGCAPLQWRHLAYLIACRSARVATHQACIPHRPLRLLHSSLHRNAGLEGGQVPRSR